MVISIIAPSLGKAGYFAIILWYLITYTELNYG